MPRYPENLRRRLTHAANVPIASSQGRVTKFELLTEATNRSKAVLDIDPIIEILAQSTRPTTAVQMLDDSSEVTVEQLRVAAAKAVIAVVTDQPELLDDANTVERFVTVQADAQPQIQSIIYRAIGVAAPSIDRTIVAQTIIPAIRSEISAGNWESETTSEAVELCGRLIAVDAGPQTELLELLTTVGNHPSTSAGHIAALGVGRALSGAQECVAPLHRLLEQLHSRSEPRVDAGIAQGMLVACEQPLESVRTVCDRLLSQLQSSPNEATRRSVPTAVDEVIGSAGETAIEVHQNLLETAFEDEADKVQEAAVEAAATAVAERDEDITPFAELLETAVLERGGAASAAAVDALGDTDIVETLASITDREQSEFTDALETHVIQGSEGGGSESAATRMQQIAGSSFDKIRQESDTPESDKPTTDSIDSERFEDAVEGFTENGSPSEVPDEFMGANDSVEQAVILESIQNWFEEYQPGEINWQPLWETLLSAWEQDTEEIKGISLRTTVAGITNGHLLWGGCRSMFDEARSANETAIRAAAINAIRELFSEREVTWDDVGSWVDKAYGDTELEVRYAAITVIGAAVGVGELDWATAEQYFNKAQASPSPTVYKGVQAALGELVSLREMEWEKLSPWLTPTVEQGRQAVAAESMKTIGRGILAGTLNWDDVDDLLIRGVESDSAQVVTEAMRSARMQLATQEESWDDVGDIVTSPSDPQRKDVIEESIKAVSASVEQGVEWEEVREHVEWVLTTTPEETASATIQPVSLGLQQGVYDWEEVESFLYEALDHEAESVAETAVWGPSHAFDEGQLSWDDINQYLWTAFVNRRSAVGDAPIGVIHDAVIDDRVSWNEIERFVEASIETENADIVGTAVETIGNGFINGPFSWRDIRDHLLTVRESDFDSAVVEAVNIVVTAAGQDLISESVAVEFLTEAFKIRDDSGKHIAVVGLLRMWSDGLVSYDRISNVIQETAQSEDEGSVYATIEGLRYVLAENPSQFESVRGFLEQAMSNRDDDIASNAVRAVEKGLTDGTTDWDEVKPFLKDALEMDSPVVASTAVNVVLEGIRAQELVWDEVEAFVRTAGTGDRPAVVEQAVSVIGCSFEDGLLQWNGVETLLMEVFTTHRTESWDVFSEWFRAVRVGLDHDAIEWQHVSSQFQAVVAEDGKAQARMALKTVEYLIESETLGWAQVEDVHKSALKNDAEIVEALASEQLYNLINGQEIELSEASDHVLGLIQRENEHSREYAIKMVGAAIEKETVTWTEAQPIIEEATALGGNLLSEGARAATTAFVYNSAEWSDVDHFIQRTIDEGEPKGIVQLSKALPQALKVDPDSWATIEDKLRRIRDEGPTEAGQNINIRLAAHLAEGNVDWETLRPFLEESRDQCSGEVETIAVKVPSSALENKTIEWETVSDFLHESLHDSNIETAKAAMLSGIKGLRNPDTPVKQVTEFIDAALQINDLAVREEAIGMIAELAQKELIKWDDVSHLLTSALEEESSEVQTAAVVAAGTGVQAETFGWNDVEEFLLTARKSSRPKTRAEAVRAVAVATMTQNLSLETFKTFIQPLTANPSEQVATQLAYGFTSLLESQDMTASEYHEWLLRIHDMEDSEPKQLAESVRNAVLTRSVPVTALEDIILRLLEADDPETRLTVLRAISPIAATKSAPLEPIAVFEAGLDDSNSGLRNFTVELLNVAIEVQDPDRETLTHLISQGANDDDPTVAGRSVKTITRAVNAGIHDNERFRSLLRETLRDTSKGADPRRGALAVMVHHWEELQFALDDVSLIALGLDSNDDQTRQFAAEGIGTVLSNVKSGAIEDYQPVLHELWERLSDDVQSVRYQTAVSLAQINGTHEVTVPSEYVDHLRQVISANEFEPSHRVQLVDLLVSADPHPVERGLI